jgi:hypothetical protein
MLETSQIKKEKFSNAVKNRAIGLLTTMVCCFSPHARRPPLHRAATPPHSAELIHYITVGPQSNMTISGKGVNLIYTWLPGKGGKIDKRVGRAASMAARPAPLLGWVGVKAH